MIDMQYNFPLLPGQPAQWRERLRAAVDSLADTAYAELRPTFRTDLSALTNVAARWLNLPADRTYLVEGNHQGSLIAMLAASLAGKPIAVDVAAYTGALEQARSLACPVVACAVDAEAMTPASLRAACERAVAAGRPIAAAYLIPTVHNPLGCVASLERRLALVQIARTFDLVLIEDAAYAYMAPDAPPHIAELAPERTFFICGLSKSYAPGARTGFMTAPPQFAAGMSSAIKNTATGANLLHARAAISLIEDGTLDAVIAAKLEEGQRRNAEARALLSANHTLPDPCWPGAPTAWHLWVNLPGHVTPQRFETTMASRGVAISGGNWFAANPQSVSASDSSTPPQMPNGFRIALGGEVDAGLVRHGVTLIAEELQRAAA